MTIRKNESNNEFKKALQNPTRPINDTETSPEMEQYLSDLNNGTLIKKEEKEKQEKERLKKKKHAKYKLFCPSCRRATLKMTSQRTYACGFCGLETNSPLVMAEEKTDGGN